MKNNDIHVRLGDRERKKSFLERVKGKACKYLDLFGVCDYDDIEYYLHVKNVIVHENYRFKDLGRNHNIALLYLEDDVPAFPGDDAPHIHRVQLYNDNGVVLNTDNNFPSSNAKCTFGGWGRITEEGEPPVVAHQVDMPIIEEEACDRSIDFNYQMCGGTKAVGIRQVIQK